MKREFSLACLVVLCTVFLGAVQAQGGYSLSSLYVVDSHRIWYTVEVESGSPPPFQDLHVETWDTDPSHYTLIVAPEGWQMDVVGKGDGSGLGWISLYSNEPCTYAFFKVEYSGGLGVLCNSAWVLTEDGDEDADTGVIPGEGGLDACGPWAGPGDPALKVAVHVLPHADRSCTRDFPVITTCSDIVSTCGANDVDFFPVFYGFQEYHCFEYSVEWPGSYSCIFTPCTYTSLGDIVWPAGTVPEEDWTDRIWQCFEGCLENPIAIPGWGWVYEPGPAVIRIVGNSASHFITVSDCSEDLYLPSCSFAAGIGGASGEEPCGPSSTEPKSWGSIKALFR